MKNNLQMQSDVCKTALQNYHCRQFESSMECRYNSNGDEVITLTKQGRGDCFSDILPSSVQVPAPAGLS